MVAGKKNGKIGERGSEQGGRAVEEGNTSGGNSRERLSALLDFCGLAAAVGEAGGAGEKLAVLPRHRTACTARRQPPAAPCRHSGVGVRQVSRSRVLEKPKQAVILLAPMGRGPRAVPRWPRPSPPSLLLQAQRRWVPPGVLVQSSVGKSPHPAASGSWSRLLLGFLLSIHVANRRLAARVGAMFNSLGLWTEK